MVEVQLIEDTVTGFVQVPYGDTKLAKKGRKHTVSLSRVPSKGEKVRTKVRDDSTGDLINTATFLMSEPPVHFDPTAHWLTDETHDIAAICTVYRVTE